MIEVYQHCIFVCSNYTTGTRKGLHFLYNESNISDVMNLADRYTAKEGVAFYFVITDKPTIESVQEKDGFFKSITILEGSESQNVVDFDNSINNQITVMDVALLLLSRQKMNVKTIKTCLFYIYCLYAKQNDSFPFKGKCFLSNHLVGFKTINKEFEKIELEKPDALLMCTKPHIIMSKFFNCEGGVELMNKVLRIFYDIKERDIDYLSNKIDIYLKKAKKIYKNSFKEKRYPFGLSKKNINTLDINCD